MTEEIFDIRKQDSEDLSSEEKLEAIFKELQIQRTKIEELESSEGFDLSNLNTFTVTNDGEPTEEAEKFRIEVIKQGKDGFTTSEMEGKLGVSNPTASSKMEQMADAFEDLQVYNPREDPETPRYNQPRRLRHREISIGKKTIPEVLKEEKEQEIIECPNCEDTDHKGKSRGVQNSRTIWKKLDWTCPKCNEKIPESVRKGKDL